MRSAVSCSGALGIGWSARRHPGEVELFVTRLAWAFTDLPFFPAIAVIRLIGNAWCTTRRMSHEVSGYLFGCYAVGGVDLRHYIACPPVGCRGVLVRAPWASRLWPPGHSAQQT